MFGLAIMSLSRCERKGPDLIFVLFVVVASRSLKLGEIIRIPIIHER
jgi:hypothetical protein